MVVITHDAVRYPIRDCELSAGPPLRFTRLGDFLVQTITATTRRVPCAEKGCRFWRLALQKGATALGLGAALAFGANIALAASMPAQLEADALSLRSATSAASLLLDGVEAVSASTMNSAVIAVPEADGVSRIVHCLGACSTGAVPATPPQSAHRTTPPGLASVVVAADDLRSFVAQTDSEELVRAGVRFVHRELTLSDTNLDTGGRGLPTALPLFLASLAGAGLIARRRSRRPD